MKIIYSILISCALLLLGSCERRPLEDMCPGEGLVPIGTVWTVADITPQNVTALFYDQNDGHLVMEHRFENSPNRIQTYADVPAGRYTVVVFNELRGQIRGVGIRGYENLSTLEAYDLPNPDFKNRSNDNDYVYDPDILASVMVRDFIVRDNEYNEALVGLEPLRKVHQFNIVAHVKGLNNARMPALVDLPGVAESYSFSEDRNTSIIATQQFTMNGRAYDTGSSKDGIIAITIYTLGLLNEVPSETNVQIDSPVKLDFLFMLVDAEKTLVRQVVDVTDLIWFKTETYGATTLNVYVELPDALPDVVPEGGEDSGFGSEVIDWDIIDVPLNAN